MNNIIGRTNQAERSGNQSADSGCTKVDVHLVSESTGTLARHLLSVVLSQFPDVDPRLHEHPFCDSDVHLQRVLESVGRSDSPLVFSALTDPDLRADLIAWCTRHTVAHQELVRPVVDFVAGNTGHVPLEDGGLVHRLNDDYLARIDAWEFSLQHDDGRRLESIGQADIILLGVSRVGKTPLTAYLGSSGYRVANVSLVRGVEVPAVLRACRSRSVGLVVAPHRLAEVRKRRFELNRFAQELRSFPGNVQEYCSPKAALADLMFAEQQFRGLRIPTLDITDQTVEEAAARVLKLLGLAVHEHAFWSA